MEFDFDAWAKLAKEDPAEFERRRALILQETIHSAPPTFRRRLEELQLGLNLERTQSATRRAAHVRTLMWVGFYRLRKELATGLPMTPRADVTPTRSAQVIPFRSGRREGRLIQRDRTER